LNLLALFVVESVCVWYHKCMHEIHMKRCHLRWKWYDYPLRPRNIRLGLKNLWFFRKELWSYRPWDYSHTLKVWEKTLEAHEKDMLASEFVNKYKTAHQTKIARLLLERVRERDVILDSFMQDPKELQSLEDKDKQDLELFNQILQKHLKRWWT
jgi:succinate dehydrogenase flavin-adding protein (antitoxin of CptAB toxin-antitoxin module)